MKRDKFIVGAIGLLLPLLSGCGATRSINMTTLSAKLMGTVQGGTEPIAGSQIQLYALINKEGSYSSTPLLSSPVVTDANGAFDIPENVVCPSNSSWVYLAGTGGTPGGRTTNNSDIAMLAVAGECGDLSGVINIDMNEVTTVASVFALSPYLRSVGDISYTNAQSQTFDTAIKMALELANPTTGTAPGTGIPAGEIAPTAKLNSLANLIASCINSSGGVVGDGSFCGQLFAEANANTEPSPTDTVQALLDIALNPTRNVYLLYLLCPPPTPFQPALESPPSDWSLDFESALMAPVLSPAPGSYDAAVSVTLSDTAPTAAIYYTLDGSAPSPSSTLYTTAIPVLASTTIRAIAVTSDQTSAAVEGAFQISIPVTPRLVILTQPQEVFAATPFPNSFSVAFEDQNGAILTTMTSTVKVQLGADPGQTGLNGSTTITAANGIATFGNLSVPVAGQAYTLVVSSPGIASVSSVPFNVITYGNISQPDLIETSGVLQTGKKLENFAAIGRPMPSIISTNAGSTLTVANGFFLPW